MFDVRSGLSFTGNLGMTKPSSSCPTAGSETGFCQRGRPRHGSEIAPMNHPPVPHLWQPTRREFLYVGLLGTVGMTMSDLFRAECRAAGKGGLGVSAGRAKS